MNCPTCQGEDSGEVLGRLGNRDHFRCRNCGAEFSANLEAMSEHELIERENWGPKDLLGFYQKFVGEKKLQDEFVTYLRSKAKEVR